MTTLDEIEARDKDTEEWLVKNDGWSHPDGPMATMHNDRKLLIRAVRQFWLLSEARRMERASLAARHHEATSSQEAGNVLMKAVAAVEMDVYALVEEK